MFLGQGVWDQTRELGGCPGVTGYLWDVYGKGLRRGKERIKVKGMSIGRRREKGGSMQGDLSSLSIRVGKMVPIGKETTNGDKCWCWLCPWDRRCAGLGASLEAAHHPQYTGQGCTAMGANCSCLGKHNQSSSRRRVAVNVLAPVLLQGGDGVGERGAHLATPRPAAACSKEGLQTGDRVGNGCWERLGTERGMG